MIRYLWYGFQRPVKRDQINDTLPVVWARTGSSAQTGRLVQADWYRQHREGPRNLIAHYDYEYQNTIGKNILWEGMMLQSLSRQFTTDDEIGGTF